MDPKHSQTFPNHMEPNNGAAGAKEVLTFCQPFKDRYDKCFNVWYRQGFLRHQLNNPCDDQFEDYKACILEELSARGLRIPGRQPNENSLVRSDETTK
eukprot:s4116_g2.t1